MNRPLLFAALAALLSLPLATPAGAGACCSCAVGCATQVVEQSNEEMYVVNQGPVFTGPGHYLAPAQTSHVGEPAVYPYVGQYYYPPDGGPALDPTNAPGFDLRFPQMHRWAHATVRVRGVRHRHRR